MRELSLNVMDIAQNSITAGAALIEILVEETSNPHMLSIQIADNGKGMDEEQVKSVTDPFYTTRTTRKVGLGIPLFKMAAEMTGGTFSIESAVGKGTTVAADFHAGHVDMTPLGDINSTIRMLILCNPDRDFVYRRTYNGESFSLDTRELREVLGADVPLSDPEVAQWVRDYLTENTQTILGGATTDEIIS